MKASEFGREMGCSDLLDIDSKPLHHLEHGHLSGTGLLHSPDRVQTERLGEQLDVLVIIEVVLEGICLVIDLHWD
jgi:hypothetical protein